MKSSQKTFQSIVLCISYPDLHIWSDFPNTNSFPIRMSKIRFHRMVLNSERILIPRLDRILPRLEYWNRTLLT